MWRLLQADLTIEFKKINLKISHHSMQTRLPIDCVLPSLHLSGSRVFGITESDIAYAQVARRQIESHMRQRLVVLLGHTYFLLDR